MGVNTPSSLNFVKQIHEAEHHHHALLLSLGILFMVGLLWCIYILEMKQQANTALQEFSVNLGLKSNNTPTPLPPPPRGVPTPNE